MFSLPGWPEKLKVSFAFSRGKVATILNVAHLIKFYLHCTFPKVNNILWVCWTKLSVCDGRWALWESVKNVAVIIMKTLEWRICCTFTVCISLSCSGGGIFSEYHCQNLTPDHNFKEYLHGEMAHPNPQF